MQIYIYLIIRRHSPPCRVLSSASSKWLRVAFTGGVKNGSVIKFITLVRKLPTAAMALTMSPIIAFLTVFSLCFNTSRLIPSSIDRVCLPVVVQKLQLILPVFQKFVLSAQPDPPLVQSSDLIRRSCGQSDASRAERALWGKVTHQSQRLQKVPLLKTAMSSLVMI